MKAISIVTGALLAAQAACMTGPRAIRDAPGDYLQANAPQTAWITLADGERLIVDGPRMISDTMFGWSEGDEIAIPVSQLKEVRVRKLSIFKSSLVPAAVLGATVWALVVTTKGEPGEDRSQECEETSGICPEMIVP